MEGECKKQIKQMSKIDINEIYTLFEEIKEIVNSKENKSEVVIPEIELPDLSGVDILSNKLDTAINEMSKPIKVEHSYVISIASNKTFIGILVLCTFCLLFLFTVVHQRKEAIALKDNDLKYRYIHMMGEATPELITNLNSIFEHRRDSVKVLRKEVISFEKAVVERARRLEEARKKEIEAERLRREIEGLTTNMND